MLLILIIINIDTCYSTFMCGSGLCLIYKYPIYFDQGYKYLLKTRTDFGRKVFGIHQRVLIAEAQYRDREILSSNLVLGAVSNVI